MHGVVEELCTWAMHMDSSPEGESVPTRMGTAFLWSQGEVQTGTFHQLSHGDISGDTSCRFHLLLSLLVMTPPLKVPWSMEPCRLSQVTPLFQFIAQPSTG